MHTLAPAYAEAGGLKMQKRSKQGHLIKHPRVSRYIADSRTDSRGIERNRIFTGMEERTGMILVKLLRILRFPVGILLAFGTTLLSPGCATNKHRTLESLAVFESIAFSPDGKHVAAGRNVFNVVLLYDVETLKVKMAFKGRQDDTWGKLSAKSLAFSPDGTFLAAAGIDDSVVVWNVNTGSEVLHLSELKGARDIAYSPNGKILAIAGPANGIHLVDFQTGRERGVLAGHRGRVNCVAFSRDGGILASGSSDCTIRFWNIATQELAAVLTGHSDPVTCISFSPDGRSVAAVAGYDIKLWQTEEGVWVEQMTDPKRLQEEENRKTTLINALMILHLVNSIRLTGAPGGWFGYQYRLRAPLKVKFSPDSGFLAMTVPRMSFSSDYEIRIINRTTKKMVSIGGQFFDLAFSPDGKILASGGIGLKLWDPHTGKRIKPHFLPASGRVK